MNGQWKLVVILMCAMLIVSVVAIMTVINNNDLRAQIKDQQKLELDSGLKDIVIESLITTPVITTVEDESLIDQTELLEFLASYVSAQKTYIKTLQQVMDNNSMKYPQFIYVELEVKDDE